MTNREQEANDALQSIAKDIKEKLPENMGFALLAYEFGEAEDKRMLYVSNSNREDVMRAMVEFLDKNINDPKMFGKDV
jgi:hypothetical protein